MKIRCRCGAVLPDQTDYLSFKAHLVADRDWEDFAASTESRGKVDATYVRLCYQCPQCGRLYVEDASRHLHVFSPEAGPAQILGSAKGEDWRGPLIGTWNDDSPSSRPKGQLWCDAEDGTAEEFADWELLAHAYYELFERLRRRDRLRSALLRRNGRDVHSWTPGA